MEKKVIFLLFLSVLPHIHAFTQTGYVNMNERLGGIPTLNDFSNTLCYTHIFQTTFHSLPQVSTSLVQFSTNTVEEFHLQIKIRKMELSRTEVRFMVFAKKQVTIWSKIVFAYLATDSQHIEAGIATLETEGLSGCGRILEQTFQISTAKKLNKPKIVAFLNGFDLQAKKIDAEFSIFEAAVSVIEQKQESFTIGVSRVSATQIYSVSIGYVVVQTFKKGDYSFDSIYKVETLREIQKASPLVISKPHEANLKNSNFLIGFEKLMLKYSDEHTTKSLAISMDATNIKLGSFNSDCVQFIQLGYMITQETMNCKVDQIIGFDKVSRQLRCQKCKQPFRVPNKDLNKCVCLQNFEEINQKCYKTPIGGKWSATEKTFICNSHHTMVYDRQQDIFLCYLTPSHQMYNTEKSEWECIQNYYKKDGQCYEIPQNGFYNSLTKHIQCLAGHQLIEGVCLRKGENEVFSSELGKFVCIEGTYRINQKCLKLYANSLYFEGRIVCKDGFYPKQIGSCQEIPGQMRYLEKENRLICIDRHFQIKDQGCIEKPQKMEYNQKLKQFYCVKDHYQVNGKCLKAQQNQQYSHELQLFICVDSTFRVGGSCLAPKPNSHYSKISAQFECNEGYYDIKGSCLSPPQFMVYSASLKIFVCARNYQDIDHECIKIPENKKWSEQFRQFYCISGYFQLANGGCGQPAQYEQYDNVMLRFKCRSGMYRNTLGACTHLPPNSYCHQEDQSLSCNLRFYKSDDQCLKCSDSCEVCLSYEKCTKCQKGFQQTNGKCVEMCGDGIRYHEQCDDGNTIDGDGCSSKCKIEGNWSCEGGSPYKKDVCKKFYPQNIEVFHQGPIELKMVGISHLFGRIVLNVKTNYLAKELLSSEAELSSMFKILTNSKIPVKVSSSFIERTKYTFVVIYDFENVEPIPEFLTRVEIEKEIKEKYFPNCSIKPLFAKINPAFMAVREKKRDIL